MKKLRTICIFLIVAFMVPAFAAGCKAKPKVSADESAKIIFNFVVKGNKAGMDKIYGDNKDYAKIRDEVKNEYVTALSKNAKNSNLSITDKQAENIYDSLMSALKKTKVSAEVKSETDKTAQVKVKTTYCDMKKATGAAVLATSKSFKPKKAASAKKIMQIFVDNYVDNLVKELNQYKVTNKTKEQTFKFVLKDKVWVPADEKAYYNGIMQLVTAE